MKCVVCKGSAVIDVRRANANFCSEHFSKFCRDQTVKSMDEFDMASPEDRLLVAVSGGKDSLAVWDILVGLGYQVDGLYVGLGIGEYSDNSGGYARRFAEERGLKLLEVDIRDEFGYDIPTGSKAARRTPCSACGTSKRHLFDRAAVEGGYDVLVTGHNLDDEAAVLFGNVLHWQTNYLARQMPVLPARNGFPKKVKPLVRLSERETAAYCIINGIDYVVDECPMSTGNRHIGYKDALNDIEVQSPGTKGQFYSGFLKRAAQLFRDSIDESADDGSDFLGACERCGSPSETELCAFCRLVDRATGSGSTGPGSTGSGSTGPVAANSTDSKQNEPAGFTQPVTLLSKSKDRPTGGRTEVH
ncbi:MAG TPA: ATP-binding protein [Microthrixaceae bacterium]|nr:ATP-binding protein [Microthrixaceae bacterium]